MTTGILGDQNATLANVVLGGLPSGLPGTVTFSVLVLDARTILVAFSSPMDNSAIDPNNYTLLAIDSPSITYQPPIASITFSGTVQDQVIIQFVGSLSFRRNYTLATSNIIDQNSDVESDSSYNFVATVPDKPRALQAFFSGTNTVDVVFDRPVAPYSVGITATLQDANSSTSTALTQVSYSTGSYPVNNIRMSFVAVPTATAYIVNVGAVHDVSFNTSDPTTLPISLISRSTPPYNTAAITNIQIIDSYVDHVSNDYLNHAFINVFFNGPVLSSDAINVANWTVTQSGAHPNADSINTISASSATDVPSLIALSNSIRTAYNNHLSNQVAHVIPDTALPSESSIITLANSLLQSHAAHVQSTVSHTYPFESDFGLTDSVLSLRAARDLNTAISNLNVIRTSYNIHRVRGDIHSYADTSYIVVNPNASDLRSAALLADELRIKLQMHYTSPYWHVVTDTSNVPTVKYLLGPTVYETPTDIVTCVGAITEVRDKYLEHISDDDAHLYSDSINVLALTDISIARYQYVSSDISIAGPVAALLKSVFNAHLNPSYPVQVYKVRDYTSISSSDASDSRSHLCEVEVSGSSLASTYSVQASVRSNDLATSTNISTYTGSISSIRNLQSLPVLLSVQSFPEGKLLLRFDREIAVLPVASYQVTSPANTPPVSVLSVKSYSSLQSLNILMNDILVAYQLHLTLAGHVSTDTSNIISDADFPQGSLSALCTSLNHFKYIFNYHASSSAYHSYATSFPVNTPDAIDIDSATQLALTLRKAFQNHNLNLGLHSYSSPTIISAKNSDGLLFNLSGVLDSGTYSMSVPMIDRITNLAGTAPSHQTSLSVRFGGVSAPPVLSAASPQSGFSFSDDGHPQLTKDNVLLVFSRPMKQVYVDSTNITFSGSVVMGGANWISDRSLLVQVSGMGTTSYNVSISGLTDTNGNAVVTNP